MKNPNYRIILFLLCAILLSSCASKKRMKVLEMEKDAMAQEISKMNIHLSSIQGEVKALQDRNSELEQEKQVLNDDLISVQQELNTTQSMVEEVEGRVIQKQKQLDQLRSEINDAFANVESAVSAIDEAMVSSSQRIETIEGMLYLDLNEDINFKSGSNEIDIEDEEVLKEIANMLQANPELTLYVEGHTDARPISNDKYEDNWDLSAARGVGVVRKLIDLGVNPSQLAAAGRAEYLPENSDNPGSAETMAANRRTEFVMVPNVGKLYRMFKEKKQAKP